MLLFSISGSHGETDQFSNLIKMAAKVKHIHVFVVQTVVAMETISHANSPTLMMSLGGIEGDVSIATSKQGCIDEILPKVQIKDIQAGTSYGGRSQRLISPFSTQVSGSATWCRHSGVSWLPRVVMFVQSGMIQVLLGQEHVMALSSLYEEILNYSKVPTQYN